MKSDFRFFSEWVIAIWLLSIIHGVVLFPIKHLGEDIWMTCLISSSFGWGVILSAVCIREYKQLKKDRDEYSNRSKETFAV